MASETKAGLMEVFCEGCGCFIAAEAAGNPQKCEDCFENELIDAVENNVWPDGMTFSVWQDIKQKYSEPEIRQ
ncbi:hypothetical protein [Planococcus faecalis]|uniref:Uncharacterized protein n=1 Tax=Planococcus faecalis TaxID=1598147 RepID=A0ABM6IT52_9BACL|nr:hypothetical protein [Planococcus faecalis]AQU79757.1 hypothetical protein AJGP001_10980 [Planococcus faecalis]OHX52049.1 hypothetical protein BB777_14040 [Planococcus faecalis]